MANGRREPKEMGRQERNMPIVHPVEKTDTTKAIGIIFTRLYTGQDDDLVAGCGNAGRI